MEIRAMRPGNEADVTLAGTLFDSPTRLDAVKKFLAEPGHHLLIAYHGNAPAGFVSGVEMTHPDKGTEMFLYELGVDEQFRRQGVGTALVSALREIAEERGCYGMWVLTDADNKAALATYARAGGSGQVDQVMLSWNLK
jgi:ribosomal protein S18 acetylase RimI-like enzyme